MGGCSDAKVTTMILNVDLDCCPCYWKVKKLLCKFPQIRDQVFDDKQNKVTITVVCCSPEKIKDKLCEKAGKSIKGIAIRESNKADPEKSKPKSEEKSKGGDDGKKEKSKEGDDEKKEKKEKSKGGDDEKKEKKEKSKGGDDEKKEKKEKSKEGDDEKKEKKEKSKGGDDDKDNRDKEKGSGEKSKEKKVSFEQQEVAAPAAAAAQAWMGEAEAQWMIPGYPPGPPPQVYPVTVCYGGGPPSHCYDGVACYQNHQGYGYSYSYSHQPHYAHPSDYYNHDNPAPCSIM